MPYAAGMDIHEKKGGNSVISKKNSRFGYRISETAVLLCFFICYFILRYQAFRLVTAVESISLMRFNWFTSLAPGS